MKFIQATKYVPLILRYRGKQCCLYIDGAHAVHYDMRGHTRIITTGGKGTLYTSSTKTNMNAASSTETEIIAVDEKLPNYIWFRYFRNA